MVITSITDRLPLPLCKAVRLPR